MADLKVETDIIASFTLSLIGWAVTLVILYAQTLKIYIYDLSVLNVIFQYQSHCDVTLIDIFQYQSQSVNTVVYNINQWDQR